MRVIISGGGTGGHIFPAIAIANCIKKRDAEAEILFVGAEGRMEMEKVPAAGYRIEGLPIAGLQRRLTLKNIAVPFKMIRSQQKVRKVIKGFRPDIVVGVGGYASAPTLKTAEKMGYDTLLQEQNSYAGLTNKMLASKAKKICVAYEGMERFFPKEKIVVTGNPVRKVIEEMDVTREESIKEMGLRGDRPVVLSIGGSLGAESINKMMLSHLKEFKERGIQLVWQTGKWMYEEAKRRVAEEGVGEWVKVHTFISKMEWAYGAADIVVSRAGAIAISELCAVGKPAILIPSPNVAEDHQTKNARALSDRGAALLIGDDECKEVGVKTIMELMEDGERRAEMSKKIKEMAHPHATEKIVDEIVKLVEQHK